MTEMEGNEQSSVERISRPSSTDPTGLNDTEAAVFEAAPPPLPAGIEEFPKTALRPPSLRAQIFHTLTEPTSSTLAYCLSFYFDGLVALSMILMCSETVTTWSRTNQQKTMWRVLETIITMNFLADFLLKVFTARPLIRYMLTRPTFTIDLLGLLPYFIEILVDLLSSDGNNSIKAFRVLRLLRFFRLSRIAYENFPDVRMFIQAIRRSKLAIAFLGMYVFGAGLFFASCIYYAETSECVLDEGRDVWFYRDKDTGDMTSQPCEIQSIFGAWWFTLVTMTTVGYGDTNVISPWGRILTVLIMIGSLIFLALPSAIFAANLTEMYLERRLMKKMHHTPPVSANSGHFRIPSARPRTSHKEAAPLTPSEELEIENLLASVEAAGEQVQSALSTLSTHLTFIHHQQQHLQSLLMEKRSK